ncbi:MAG: peptide chain release factor N(5)-glutamine methyltransferase, partial [Elusimicrobiota bacterium]|nr:peptide chain release factor N(5)-glutamine methyltransferase [Elusimicrobiota bacterium]
MNSNTAQALSRAAVELAKAGIDNSRLEAEYILAEVQGIGRNELLAGLSGELSPEVREVYFHNIEKRATRIPFGYIFKKANFMGLDLTVNEETLIPRPETEILTEEAIKYLKTKTGNLNVLDIGTGSGNIATVIAKLTGARVTAADISEETLKVASQNARAHNVDDRIKFIKSDLYKNLTADFLKKFDLIISNPPYVNLKEYAKIQPEVKKEPQLALVAGDGGLNIIKKILLRAPN